MTHSPLRPAQERSLFLTGTPRGLRERPMCLLCFPILLLNHFPLFPQDSQHMWSSCHWPTDFPGNSLPQNTYYSPATHKFSDSFSSWVTFSPLYSCHHFWSVENPYRDLARLWGLKVCSVFTCTIHFLHYLWAACLWLSLHLVNISTYEIENLHCKPPTTNTIPCPASSPVMFPLKLHSDLWTCHFGSRYCLISLILKREISLTSHSVLSALLHS